MPNNETIERIAEIKQRLEKATKGPWEYSTFTHHSGRELKTVQDVAETTAFSALQSERVELFGAALVDKDADGRNIVVCYTGNGPNSHNNANVIAHAPSDIEYLLAALQEMRTVALREAAEIAEQCPISELKSMGRGELRYLSPKIMKQRIAAAIFGRIDK